MKCRRAWMSYILVVLGFPSAVHARPLPQNAGDIQQDIRNFLHRGSKVPVAPFQAVTTSIKDAYPLATWLDRYSEVVKPQTANTLTLPPGYYRITVRSYCLHAGAYAPTQGVGYLLSPLKGTASGLITDILKSSEQHPEVAQQDVQVLIWGIEAGTKFSQYSPTFRARVVPLLTAQNIAIMDADSFLSSLRINLPQGFSQIASYFEQFRSMLTNPNMNYAQLEQFAVRTGTPPIGPGSLNYQIGPWAYAQQQGFYVREVNHNGYQATELEILRPGSYVLTRDNQGRISQLRSGTSSIAVSYQDETVAPVAASADFPAGRTSKIKRINVMEVGGERNGALAFSSSPLLSPGAAPTSWTNSLQDIKQYGQKINHSEVQSPQTAQDLADLAALLDGLTPATANHANLVGAPGIRTVSLSTGRATQATGKNVSVQSFAQETILNAWVFASCVHLGQCTAGSENESSGVNQPGRLELAGLVQSPANTAMQRLAQSSCPPGNSCPATSSHARIVARLETLNGQLQQIQNDLMWIDCAPTGPNQVIADFVAALTEPVTGQMTQTGEFVYEVAETLQDGNPVVMADTVLVPALMQEEGFSCNNYDTATAIIKAAKTFAESHTMPVSSANSVASHTIIPGSIHYGPALISFSVVAGEGTRSGTTEVNITFVACTQGSSCPASVTPNSLTSPAITHVTGKLIATGVTTNQASVNSQIAISITPSALVTRGKAAVLGVVHDASGKPIAGAAVQLTATTGGKTTLPSTLTTDANGAFSAPFTAPPTPGVVTIRATASGSSPPIVATATLKVGAETGMQSGAKPQSNTKSPQRVAATGDATKGGIRSVDFKNSDYPSNCSQDFDVPPVVHVTNGKWDAQDNGHFEVTKVVYGDVTGVGQDGAVVLTNCYGDANFADKELFVFAMSPSGPQLLPRILASDLGGNPVDVQIGKKYVDVSYPDGGSNACPDWLVTARYEWNGAHFVRVGQTRKPYKCL